MVELDEAQRSAATVRASARQIVLAPPGSGKTEVVVSLVQHLLHEEGLAAADDVLVVSFSRAAVATMRSRVGEGTSGVGSTGIRTLDSLASQLLIECSDVGPAGLTFEQRILAATRLVGAGEAEMLTDSLAHVIVDEVQDLVGARADLALALLGSLPASCGFTLLGDPQQAIYDFQLADESATTSAMFLAAVAELGDVREVSLSGSYRARSTEARDAVLLNRPSDPFEQRVRGLRTFLAERLQAAGDLAALGGPMKRWRGTTALLCRTNGEALVVAQTLLEAGLDATLRAPADELPLAGWIGRVIARVESSSMPREQFTQAAQQEGVDPTNSWRLLKGVERDFRSPGRLDLRRLARGLGQGAASTNLTAADPGIVVSTVHRAKGLEFDNVVVVNARHLLPGNTGPDDVAVAYVAVTRPRERLVTARCDVPKEITLDKATSRWVRTGFQRGLTFGFEVRGADTRHAVRSAVDPVAAPGARAIGKVNRSLSTLERPIYDLSAAGVVVARTNDAFGDLLARRLRGFRRTGRPWPDLGGLFVESTETVVDPLDARSAHGICTGVRVSGLADLIWDGIKED